MNLNKICIIGVSVVGLLAWTSLAPIQAALPVKATINIGEATKGSATDAPTPVDPYPLNAAGWGPEAGNGLMVSRWAEDWTGKRAAGHAPLFKAMPISREVSLTLSAETRLRYDLYDNGQLARDNDYQQGLFRGILGADIRFGTHFRFYGEIGTGQVEGYANATTANFQNDASFQQLFVDIRGYVGSILLGTMIGRQEFADGPRQLISLSDGPNLHRTWNGARFYAHGKRFRLGAFDLFATSLGRGAFDEEINCAEHLQGINASLIVLPGDELNTYLDPFWIHSQNPNFSVGNRVGLDNRDTFGARLWGQGGGIRFDWTLAHQTGKTMSRDIDAWGLFAVHSLALSNQGWKPRLTAHTDLASGGGAYGAETLRGFNQIYASSNYLGEGQFLSLSNLLMIAPGISVSPTQGTNISIEYGFAWRLEENDAAYAGGMRAYAGTPNLPGHEIGGLLRFVGILGVGKYLTLFINCEHLAAGDLLKSARLPDGSYGYVGMTFRY